MSIAVNQVLRGPAALLMAISKVPWDCTYYLSLSWRGAISAIASTLMCDSKIGHVVLMLGEIKLNLQRDIIVC